MERTRKIIITIGVLLGLFALAWMDWQFGGLKFVNPQYDETISTLALCLPAACVLLLVCLPHSIPRGWGFICGIPLALLCLFSALMGFDGGPFPEGITRLSSTRLGHSRINAYYGNSGAMDDGHVYVQQEFKLLPGVVWVVPLLNESTTMTVKVSVVDRHHVQCEYTAYSYPSTGGTPASKPERDVDWVF